MVSALFKHSYFPVQDITSNFNSFVIECTTAHAQLGQKWNIQITSPYPFANLRVATELHRVPRANMANKFVR